MNKINETAKTGELWQDPIDKDIVIILSINNLGKVKYYSVNRSLLFEREIRFLEAWYTIKLS